MEAECRVLSIQSHVVHGYVGNKAAVFPLQILGFDVDVCNSVHFSNHTGHPNGWEGDVLKGEQLKAILDGLERNHLLDDVGHLLTGYIGSVSFLTAVLDVLTTLRKNSKKEKVRFICDPVLGDGGKFYVPHELVSVYRTQVVPLADIVTPNQFEVEQLTGICIKTMDDATKACQALHDMGPSIVIITSIILQQSDETNNPTTISILASERKQPKQDGDQLHDELWCIDSPIIEGKYTGTGDLCAALILGWSAKNPSNLPLVLEKVVSTMYHVIQYTRRCYKETVASNELKIIQSKDIIENPPNTFRARKLGSS